MVPHLPKSPEKKVGFEAFKEACKKVVSSLETIAGILLRYRDRNYNIFLIVGSGFVAMQELLKVRAA